MGGGNLVTISSNEFGLAEKTSSLKYVCLNVSNNYKLSAILFSATIIDAHEFVVTIDILNRHCVL